MSLTVSCSSACTPMSSSMYHITATSRSNRLRETRSISSPTVMTILFIAGNTGSLSSSQSVPPKLNSKQIKNLSAYEVKNIRIPSFKHRYDPVQYPKENAILSSGYEPDNEEVESESITETECDIAIPEFEEPKKLKKWERTPLNPDQKVINKNKYHKRKLSDKIYSKKMSLDEWEHLQKAEAKRIHLQEIRIQKVTNEKKRNLGRLDKLEVQLTTPEAVAKNSPQQKRWKFSIYSREKNEITHNANNKHVVNNVFRDDGSPETDKIFNVAEDWDMQFARKK